MNNSEFSYSFPCEIKAAHNVTKLIEAELPAFFALADKNHVQIDTQKVTVEKIDGNYCNVQLAYRSGLSKYHTLDDKSLEAINGILLKTINDKLHR